MHSELEAAFASLTHHNVGEILFEIGKKISKTDGDVDAAPYWRCAATRGTFAAQRELYRAWHLDEGLFLAVCDDYGPESGHIPLLREFIEKVEEIESYLGCRSADLPEAHHFEVFVMSYGDFPGAWEAAHSCFREILDEALFFNVKNSSGEVRIFPPREHRDSLIKLQEECRAALEKYANGEGEDDEALAEDFWLNFDAEGLLLGFLSVQGRANCFVRWSTVVRAKDHLEAVHVAVSALRDNRHSHILKVRFQTGEATEISASRFAIVEKGTAGPSLR